MYDADTYYDRLHYAGVECRGALAYAIFDHSITITYSITI